MTEYEKLLNIVENYISSNTNTEVAEKFCNEFMEEFYSIQDILEKEVEQHIYELFDDINLICDSYEPNAEIRENDKYCVDEIDLRNKVRLIYQKMVS